MTTPPISAPEQLAPNLIDGQHEGGRCRERRGQSRGRDEMLDVHDECSSVINFYERVQNISSHGLASGET